MRTLLIYPEYPATFWSFKYALKFIRKRAALPPLGLLTIGAMLPKEWSKKLVDLNVTKLTDKDLAWADYAFISGMVVQRQSAREIIARCKAANLKVIAGGPLFPRAGLFRGRLRRLFGDLPCRFLRPLLAGLLRHR